MSAITPGTAVSLVRGTVELAATVTAVDGPGGATLVLAVPTAELPSFGAAETVLVEWSTMHGLAIAQGAARRNAGNVEVTLVDDAEHVQRRRYVRVPVHTELHLRDSFGSWVDGTLMDLSEGGARVRYVGLLPATAGTGTRVRLELGDEVRIETPASVLRAEQLEDQVYELVLTFPAFPEKTAAALRRFLFTRQRELRDRGVL